MSLSFRSYLEKLAREGKMLSVRKPVSVEFELGALLNENKGSQPILFDNIKGYTGVRAAGGIGGCRQLVAEALGVTKKELIPKLIQGISSPIEPRLVPHGSVHENVITNNIDLLKMFPIPKFHEKDSGHFITAGLLLVKDPIRGRRYTSIRRLQFNGGNNLSVLIESPGLINMYHEYESRNEPLEIAIILGVHPAITLTSQLSTQTFGLDKIAVAGGLLGEPVDLVKCKTVDLEVPATSEIVLEGRMIPHKRLTEGPFGELAGYYGPATEQPYAEISAVTFRNEPIFQVIFPSSWEHTLPNALNREVSLFLGVRHIVPSVKEVHITMPGGGRFHGIISIDKQAEGQGKSAIFAALSSNKDMKHVIVVNDDVDIFNPADVEWALATRVQADQDVIIVPGAQGSPLEPSHTIRGVSAKMGIDATYPLAHKEKFERTYIPGSESIRLKDYLV